MTRAGSHWLGIALVLLGAMLGQRAALTSVGPLADEAAYVCAAHATLEARALDTCPRYLYGPALARASAVVLAAAGEPALLGALRASIWLGAAMVVWWSLALTGWSWRWRAFVGVGATFVWPPLTQSLRVGNVSSLVAALTLAALMLVERRALLGGLVLALAISIKPLPVAVPVVLLGGALGELVRTRRAAWPPLVSGGSALLLAATLGVVGGGFGQPPPFDPAIQDSITLVRLLRMLGLAATPLAVFVGVVSAGAALAARFAWPYRTLAGFSLVVSLLSSPLVWNHSWLLVTPLLVVATERAVARYRGASAESRDRPRGLLELVWVGLAGLVLSFSDALGGVLEQTPWGAVGVAVPLLAPLGLWLYAARPGGWVTPTNPARAHPTKPGR